MVSYDFASHGATHYGRLTYQLTALVDGGPWPPAADQEVRDADYQPALGIALWPQASKAVLLCPQSLKGLDISRETDYAVMRGGHEGPVIAFAVGSVEGQVGTVN